MGLLLDSKEKDPNQSPLDDRFGSLHPGGDKRDRTADLLNAIAPEVLGSVEMV